MDKHTSDSAGNFVSLHVTQDARQNFCTTCGKGPFEVSWAHDRTCKFYVPKPGTIAYGEYVASNSAPGV